MTVSDGVSPSPKGEEGGADSAPSKSATGQSSTTMIIQQFESTIFNNLLCVKLSVIVANRKLFDLMVEVSIAHCRSRLYHGLYGSTSCCIAMSLVNGRWRFSTSPPPTAPRPLDQVDETLIYNYFPDTTPHAKFQGSMSTWVAWAKSQFDA